MGLGDEADDGSREGDFKAPRTLDWPYDNTLHAVCRPISLSVVRGTYYPICSARIDHPVVFVDVRGNP